jgi:hypothetical protein
VRLPPLRYAGSGRIGSAVATASASAISAAIEPLGIARDIAYGAFFGIAMATCFSLRTRWRRSAKRRANPS